MSFRSFLVLFVPACLLAARVIAAAPVLDEPVPLDNGGAPAQVAPRVFVGKALVFPITATDADGEMLRYKVKSSSPNVLVRARTGHPHLRLTISHAGNGTAADPAFSGVMEFALLRDLTPITSEIIAGLAHADFYNNQIFHRIANLDANEDADGSFIIQGGDPQGTGSGGPGFQFENEFKAPLIFSGRGQLAMANSGSSTSTYKGSNGSQFFITDGSPRFLDFNHTIFGQLLRGWDLLDKMTKVPRNAQDKPLVDVRIDSAEVVPNFADALLLISATAPGTATITVTVDDGTSEPVSKAFTVSAVRDKFNDPPFLEPVAPKTVAKETVLEVPLRAVDLESDFLFYGNKVLSFGAGSSSGSGNPARVIGSNGYTGPLALGVSVFDYDMTYRGPIDGPEGGNDDLKPVAIGVGDRAIDAKAISFEAIPGAPLNGQTVATYIDADPRAQPSDFAAQINWGDGTPLTTGVIVRDPSQPGVAHFAVQGTHIYQREGVFPVTVELTGNKGAKAIKRGTALVSTDSVKALGASFAASAEVENRVVATFTDTATLSASDYSAEINWGDGRVSAGKLSQERNSFEVRGSHRYKDAGDFAVTVRVRRKSGPSAPDAIAWSTARIGKMGTAKHLPPFKIAHLIGQIGDVEVPNSNGTQFKAVRSTIGGQTYLTIELIVLNAGAKASQPGKLRFYLSADKTLNLAARTLPDPENPGQTYVNPADRLITIGDQPEGNLQAIAPGGGVRYIFDQANASSDLRLRLPPGENGSAFNLLAHFDYHDPIGDHMPIAREVVYGPFNGFIVKPMSLSVQEAAAGDGAAKTFTVKMDRRPSAPVTIALSVDKPAELLVAPLTLTFTPENFATKQTVTVTAKDDNAVDGAKNVRVTLAPAVSDDRQWNGIDPDDVAVLVLDKATAP